MAMKNSEALAIAIEKCAENAEVVERLTAIKNSYDTKSDSTSKEKAEKRQDNLETAKSYLDLMEANKKYTATEVAKLATDNGLGGEKGVSTSKVNAAFTVAEEEGLVTIAKEKENGKGKEKNFFTKVVTETEEVADGQ